MQYQLQFITGQPYKVHHTFIWMSSLMAFGAAILLGLIPNLGQVIQGAIALSREGVNLLPWIVGGLLLIVAVYGLMVALNVLRYRNLYYVFDENEFSLYSGIITKKHMHVPYARVQSVNHKQSLFQRLAGVCSVEIETAGGSDNQAVRVPYVLLGTGEAIRQDLFVRKALSVQENAGAPAAVAPPAVPAPPSMPPAASGAPIHPLATPQATQAPDTMNFLDRTTVELGDDQFRGVFESAAVGMEPVSYEARLTNKELVLAGLSQSGLLGAVLVLLATIVLAVVALLAIPRAYTSVAIPVVLMSTLSMGWVVLLIAIISIPATILGFGKFSVRRRGSRIEVERGILNRDFSGIDIERIQSINVRQSFVRRLLGYCEVSLGRVRAAGDSSKEGTNAKLNQGALVVHPFYRLEDVDSLLDGLLPEFADRPHSETFTGLPPVALRRGIIRRCVIRNPLFWLVVTIALLHIGFAAVVAAAQGSSGTAASSLQHAFSVVNILCIASYVLCIAATVLFVLGTIWWHKGSGFALTKAWAAVRNDGLQTDTVWVPRTKIQDTFTRTNPFQRKAHTTTIGLTTAAGSGTQVGLWDVTEEDGDAWRDWLKPRKS